MTKFFVDTIGDYLGGFDGASPTTPGAIEVSAPPADGRQKWANGAWVALALIPQVLTPRQFRQSLTHFGYRTAVEAAVAAADQDTKDWYEKASSFERTHPVVLSMAQALGYTSTQIDAVWTYGAAR